MEKVEPLNAAQRTNNILRLFEYELKILNPKDVDALYIAIFHQILEAEEEVRRSLSPSNETEHIQLQFKQKKTRK